jgi:hypothetical protein
VKDTHELTNDERRELCGGDPDELYPIPSDARFTEAGAGRLEAPDLEALGKRLIAIKALDIDHLSKFRVGYLWSKSGGTSGSKKRLGNVTLANPDLKHFTSQIDGEPLDALVRLAADNLREAEATRWQVAGQLCHLLSRLGLVITQEGGDERLALVAPDASFFRKEIAVFGPHTLDLKNAAKTLIAARQMGFQWSETDDDDHEPGNQSAVAVQSDWKDVPVETSTMDDVVADLTEVGHSGESAPIKPSKATKKNGKHDSAQDILIDPDRVVATLTEKGTPIVFQDGRYMHPTGLPIYSNDWAEGEYRSAISGTTR